MRLRMAKPLQVLFLAGELAPWKQGGIAAVVRGLGNALASREEIQLSILGTLPTGVALTGPWYDPRIQDYCAHVRHLPRPLRRLALQSDYVRQVRRWLRDVDAPERAVVHAHLLPGFRLMLPVLEALRAKVPLVQTVYDWLPLEIPYYSKLKWGFRAHWTIAQPLLRRATTFTVNSNFIGQYVRSRWPRSEVHIVPNAVSEASQWLAVPPPPTGGPFTFFYWGELYEKKGPLILVEAARQLREQHPTLPFRVWMGGSGPQEKVLRDTIARSGLQAEVEVLGPIPQEELYKRIAAAHAVVMPSAYEGFGIAILEAMTAGRAVITTNVGGATEIINAADQGVLVSRTPEAYASAMASLAQRPDRARAIGEAARERSREFAWSDCADQFLDVFNIACAQRGTAA